MGKPMVNKAIRPCFWRGGSLGGGRLTLAIIRAFDVDESLNQKDTNDVGGRISYIAVLASSYQPSEV